MAARLFQIPKEVPLTITGALIPGAKANFYISGTTTTRQDTFTDEALTTPHTNPVIADANGFFEPIYLDDTLEYRVDITDASDSSLPGYPVDNLAISSGNNATATSLTDAEGNYVSTNLEDAALETALGAGFGDQVRSALADQAVASNSILLDDAELAGISLDPDTLYEYQAFIPYNQNTGDFQFDMSITQAEQWSKMGFSMWDQGGTTQHDIVTAAIVFGNGPYTITTMTDTQRVVLLLEGSFLSHVSQNSTITFQWAQVNISANATTREKGAWFRVRKLQ